MRWKTLGGATLVGILLSVTAQAANIDGTSGNDCLGGSSSADVIRGFDAGDELFGRDGADDIYGKIQATR